jgi:hypothetical protein
MTDYNDRRSIGIGVSIDTTSIPFRYPFFKSTADTDPILSIAIGDTIGTDSATDINNPDRDCFDETDTDKLLELDLELKLSTSHDCVATQPESVASQAVISCNTTDIVLEI